MKRNLMKLATVAAMATGLALAQTPAPAPHAARPPHAAMRQHMMQALNLTDAQKEQAKSIFQQARTNAQPFRQELRQNHQAMVQAIHSDDEATIQRLSKTQGDLTSKILANRNVAAAQFYKILTPEQRAKADQMRQSIRQHMEQRRGQRTNG